MKVLLVDVSAIAHPLFHTTGDDPDPNAISDGIVAKVRSLAGGHDRVAVCVERGKSFRCELSAEYKAHRESKPASFYHQYDRAADILAKDGYLVLGAPTFEADDVIATACTWLRGQDPPHEVTIATGDKDLLQLVGDGVLVHKLQNGAMTDAAGVVEKFGVKPEQMRDYLSLVGDASDGVTGAKGIGPVKAKELIGRFGSLVGIYCAIEGKNPDDVDLPPSTLKALRESAGTVALASKLIALRTDAPIDCASILTERAPAPLVEVEPEAPEVEAAAIVQAEPAKTDALALAPVEAKWELALEPRVPAEAITLARHLFNSRALKGYSAWEAALGVILAGREMGVPAMAALRGFCVIEGKIAMYADFVHALVLRSGKAEYIEMVESTPESATWVTRRLPPEGSTRQPREVTMTYTLAEAKAANLVKSGGAWATRPKGQCRKQALVELLRLVYPDVVGNMYDPEEF